LAQVQYNLQMPLKRFSNTAGPYGFIAPAIILILIFGFIPVVLAGYISLFKFPLVNPAMRVFIGLINYIDLFQDASLRQAFLNTIYYAVLLVPAQSAGALMLALLVEKPLRGIGLFRTLFYIPIVISMVVAATIWKVMLDTQSGIINSVLVWLGLEPYQFLLNEPWNTFFLIVVGAVLAWHTIDPGLDLNLAWAVAIVAFGVFLVISSIERRGGA